jgi:PIN domain nuclease of toxin-antitoxin system
MGSISVTPPGKRKSRNGAPFLLDTHIWFWYLTGSDRLPVSLRRAIDAALGQLWLSPVSIWELGMLHERGRVKISTGLRPWVSDAQRIFPLQEATLSREVALVSSELRLAHRDPADHFLAATALVYGLTLVTVDERLEAENRLPTRSH